MFAIIIIRTNHLKLFTRFKVYNTKQYAIDCVFSERSNIFLRGTAIRDEMSANGKTFTRYYMLYY